MRLRASTTAAPGGGVEPQLHLDFLSSDECAGQGVTLLPAATPPTVNQGMALNGTTQYATIQLAWYAQAFQGGAPGALSIYCEFFPNFNYSAVQFGVLCYTPVANRYNIIKTNAGPNFDLQFTAGSVVIGTIAGGVYGGLWRVAGKNRVLMTAVSGTNDFYLNGTSIGTSVTAWSRVLPSLLNVGSATPDAAIYFDGTITDFRIYNRKLTSAEALQLTALT